MRISDWSSDVCSSELPPLGVVPLIQLIASKAGGFEEAGKRLLRRIGARPPAFLAHRLGLQRQAARDQRQTARRRLGFDGARSEERRVGKECVSTVSHSVAAVAYKNKNKIEDRN